MHNCDHKYLLQMSKQTAGFFGKLKDISYVEVPSDLGYELDETIPRPTPRESSLVKPHNLKIKSDALKSLNPFIQNDLTVAVHDVRRIKDAYTARELRKISNEFSSFEQIKLYFLIRIFTGSWNVAGQPSTESLLPWLQPANDCDLVVIGFQEVDLSTEAYLVYDPLKEIEWSSSVNKCLNGYAKIASKQLIGMLLIVYCKLDLKNFIAEITAESIGSGMLGLLGNKGATAIRMRIHDSYYTFINSHLAADANQTERRNEDYVYISKRLVFPISGYDDSHDYYQAHPWVSSFFDHAPSLNGSSSPPNGTFIPFSANTNTKFLSIFDTEYLQLNSHLIWVGDLNYRINLAEQITKSHIISNNLAHLQSHDQVGKIN